jgi:BolA protein
MSVAARIRERLAALEPLALELVDESAKHEGHAGARPGGNTHWRLTIVSQRFAGKPTVARHRMVYQALGELMQDPIHALAITARAPEETKGNQ